MLQPPGSMGLLQAPGCAEPLSVPQNPPDTPQSCSPHDKISPLCCLSPCTHQALGEGFHPVPTHHPRYLRELPTPRHVSISTSSQVGPAAQFVCRGRCAGSSRTWGGHVRGGTLVAWPCPSTEGSPLSAAGSVTSQHRDLPPARGQSRKQARGTAALHSCIALGIAQVGVIN